MDVFVRVVNGLLMMMVPIVLAAVLSRRWRLPRRIFWLGVGTFIGSQVLHIPFNRFVLQPLMTALGLEGVSAGLPFALVAVLLGLSAGVFEESARYLVYRRFLPREDRWRGAVFYGAGHGGVESFLVGILALYVLLQALALRGADLSLTVPAEQVQLAEQQLSVYWSAPWHAALLGAVERILALVFQISLAVMVLQSVKRRNRWWLAAAIAWHAFVDAVAVFAAQIWGVYWAEACILCAAILSLWILWRLWEPVPRAMDVESPAPVPHPVVAQDLEQSPDLLRESMERSRYTADQD
jgi:uncharacterized membrane protein YhfC